MNPPGPTTYFPASTQEQRLANVRSNVRALNDAAELGATCFVMVVGGVPKGSRDLPAARMQVRDGIGALLEQAHKLAVPLAIEPLHPMYAGERSVANTIDQAQAIARELDPHNDGFLGVAVDVYHCWWEPQLEGALTSIGNDNRILAYHVSDWLVPTTDLLLDRGMMGDGVIDPKRFRQRVENAGYAGMDEVEILSRDKWWKLPPGQVLQKCAERLQSVC